MGTVMSRLTISRKLIFNIRSGSNMLARLKKWASLAHGWNQAAAPGATKHIVGTIIGQ
jgi:hypothetical protein